MIKILVVDDERIIRKGIEIIIRERIEDAEALLAENGERALEIVREENPQIVVTDIKMPDMDGIRMMEHIREFDKKIVFIVLSGYNDFSFCKKALRNKAMDYLLKPVDEDELVCTIKKAIDVAKGAMTLEEKDFHAGRSKTVQDMLEYVKLHYKEQITLDTLAERLHFNARYLSQLFKKESGMNFVDYLNKVRIDKAKILLRQGNATMDGIASEVGYCDAKYFAKTFKKIENKTPSEYRNEIW